MEETQVAQGTPFYQRLLAAARPHLRPFDWVLYGITAVVVLGYLFLRNPQNFWAEFGIRMLEIAAIVFLVAIIFVWAGLKMEPTLEPTRRNFLAAMMIVGSSAMFGFGRSSKQHLPLATDEEISNRFITGRTLRLTQVASPDGTISGKRFENCDIYGPAVLFGGDGLELRDCDHDAPVEAVVLEISDSQRLFWGGFHFKDVEFLGCRLHQISFGVPSRNAERVRQMLVGSGYVDHLD